MGAERGGAASLQSHLRLPFFFSFFFKSCCAHLGRTCARVHKVGSWIACQLVVLTAGILRRQTVGKNTFLFRFPDESGDIFQCCH